MNEKDTQEIAICSDLLKNGTTTRSEFTIDNRLVQRSSVDTDVWQIFAPSGQDKFIFVDAIRPEQFGSARQLWQHIRRLPEDTSSSDAEDAAELDPHEVGFR